MDLQGTQNGDTLTGGADSDTIYGFAGNDTLKGLAGDDVLAGHDGNDNLQGGAGEDYLLGGAGNDTIDGGAGNDWAAYEDATAGVKVDLTITGAQNTVGGGTDKLVGIENVYGSAFNDTLTGNADNNMLVGDAGNDIVSGGKGDDTLWGDVGNDTLDGGDGDDYMVGGAGDDLIKGGAGVDWSSYENATAGVTVDLNKTTVQDTIGAGKDTITGVELLYGGKFDDVLTGDAKDNYLWGTEGNDKLYGGAGDDHLSGGAGVNIIDGGDGFDTVDYAFSDAGVTINLQPAVPPVFSGPESHDVITSIEAAMGSAFDDLIIGNASENYLFGDAGDDVLQAVGGNDTMDGGDGDDYLFGSASGGDLLIGGAGDDVLSVSTGLTIVEGGDGVDTLQISPAMADAFKGYKVDLRITGEQEITLGVRVQMSGVENVTGGAGNDILIGDAKDNVLMGGSAGDDTLDGGEGSDTVKYLDDGKLGYVVIDLGKTVQTLTEGRGTDTLISIENVIGTSGADQITGNVSANHLRGEDGNDWLEAIGGNDLLEGGYGDDTLIATREGASSDKLFGGAGDDQLVTNKSGALLDGGDGDDRFNVSHFANLVGTVVIDGGAGADTLDMRGAYGPIANLTISLAVQGRQDVGQGQFLDVKGVENILGGSGNDRLTGDAGDNLLAGGAGDDVLDGGAGLDIASYDDYNFQTSVRVDLRNAVQTDLGGRGTDTFISIEGVRGTAFGDILIGNDKDNLFIGGAGDDVIDGGAGIDTVSYLNDGLQTGAYVNLWLEAQVASDRGVDRLVSIENVIGSAYDDTISGSDGANVLIGGAGNDALDGRGGADLLDGGVGDDLLSTYWEQGGVWVNGAGSVLRGGEGRDNFDLGLGDLRAEGDVGDDHFNLNNLAGAKVIDGGDGYDSIQFEVRIGMGVDYTNGVTVDLTKTGSQQIATGVTATITSIERIFGSQGADLIIGDNADNYLDGFDGNDVVKGGGGADTLSGRNGSDTLTGGSGGDTLWGGADSDTFVFAAGDTTWSLNSEAGLDVIRDWTFIDKLSFGPRSGSANYFEQTTSSWLGALTIAPQAMATLHLSYLAIQVGSDTYVFAAQPGTSTGQIESVVKLVGVGLDAIGAENFI